jgi:hypothetical protein
LNQVVGYELESFGFEAHKIVEGVQQLQAVKNVFDS